MEPTNLKEAKEKLLSLNKEMYKSFEPQITRIELSMSETVAYLFTYGIILGFERGENVGRIHGIEQAKSIVKTVCKS